MLLNGSEILIECLKEQGVDTVFGFPGAAIINVYDALYHHPEIRHVLTSHEQGAAHAADGYARATGRTGVVLATSGPGATNLVTGIATACMDSVPLVAITCNVGVALLGKDSFQEIDITGITMPITKYSTIVRDIRDLAPMIRKAFRIAGSGRPGPVLVDITKNVTEASYEYTRVEAVPPVRKTETISDSGLEEARSLIRFSQRPVLLVGGGAVTSGAHEEIRRLAHRIDAPVCDTLMGKGAFPGTDPLYMGMLGMHGTKTANRAISHCDLLIAAGTRFADRDTGKTSAFAHQAKILQLDIDAAEIDKNVLVDAYVIGDLKESLTRLLSGLDRLEHSDWLEEVEEAKARYPLEYPSPRLTAPYVMKELYRLTGGDAIITTDVGQHQLWAAQYYTYTQPRTFLSPGGLGTMGFGLGAAMGAKIGCPDRTVINIAGDGCFRMNMNEVMSTVRNGVKVIEIIMDNRVLGMVRQWQRLFFQQRYAHTGLDDGADFVRIAEGMGAVGIRVTRKEEVEGAILRALEEPGTVVIDCMIDPDDMVLPMAPAGKPIETAFDQSDLSFQI